MRLHNSLIRQTGRLGTAVTLMLAVMAAVAGFLTFQAGKTDFDTLSGERYRWAELQGQWVVINYFAEWCSPCLREIPELNQFNAQQNAQLNAQQNAQLNAQQKDAVRLFGISYDPLSVEQIQTLADKYAIEFPMIVVDEDTRLPIEPPQYLPATFIIAPDGSLAASLMGEQTSSQLNEIIMTLKAQQSQAL